MVPATLASAVKRKGASDTDGDEKRLDAGRGKTLIGREIRRLGKDRIWEFHLKDNPRHLGKGSIDFA